MGRRFLRIQTGNSGETWFFTTVYGAILGLMRLNFLSVGTRAPAQSGGKSLVLRVTSCQPLTLALAQIMASGSFRRWVRRTAKLFSGGFVQLNALEVGNDGVAWGVFQAWRGFACLEKPISPCRPNLTATTLGASCVCIHWAIGINYT